MNRRRVRIDTHEPGTLVTHEALRQLRPRDLVRAVKIGNAAIRYVLPGLLRKKGRTAEALAPRIYRMVVALGPPFVKLSQLVASSPGLFPAPISNALSGLLDDAEPEPWPPIKATIEHELGPLQKRFASLDHQPLAAASIAQVHGATLLDGTEVVVKVRRPGIERRFLSDLRLLHRTARFAAWKWSYARVLNPVGIVDNVVTTLHGELDFRIEADAMERFDKNLKSFGDNERMRVPEVHRDLSGAAVLTMERVYGIRVDNLLELELTGFDLFPLIRGGVRAWIEAAVEHGFFHGDVHAGNLMLDGDGRVVFLDFGIVGELDETTRKLVRRGVVALLHHKDFQTVVDCLIELGARLGYEGERDRAVAAIAEIAQPLLGKTIGELDYQEIFLTAVRRGAPKGVQLPLSMVLLVKQVLYFERYAKLIAPDWNILEDTYLIEFMIEEDQDAYEVALES